MRSGSSDKALTTLRTAAVGEAFASAEHITGTYMGNETPNKGGPSDRTAPGKPASRQPPDANTGQGKEEDKAKNREKDEGQEIPKTA